MSQNILPSSHHVSKTEALLAGRYELLDLIGTGAVGAVFRAIDHLTGQTVALKQLAITPASSDLAQITLAREFKILASLRHPHIISVLDYGFGENRQAFFTMEYLHQAQTLFDYATRQPQEKKIDLLLQLLQALMYLHRGGIVHRDLKPANVMVVNGQIRLLDFGLAMQRDSQPSKVAGTVLYMAPEVIQGLPPSVASDLYAVGILAYELLGGQPPFLSVMEILEKPPDTGNLPVHPDLQAVIKRLLEKNPINRYQNAETVLDLVAAAAKYPLPPETRAIQESFLEAAKFVGREAELQQLTNALKQAMEGKGSAWLIGGESGVGKSRLMAELGTQALVEGVLVLQGQAIAEDGSLYQVWHSVLRRLCLHAKLSDFEAGVLKSLVPDIERLLRRTVPDAPLLDPTLVQNRLLLVIESIFRRQARPIVLLIGDLHWAQDSLIVLKMLNQIVSRLPILIIASYRDDEFANLPDLLPGMHFMKLTGLSPEAIVQLSQSILGEVGQHPQIVELLVRETEGNAFFIVEFIRALAETTGQLRQIGSVPLPATLFPKSIKAVIQQRLRHIPEQARELLHAAAIAGRELDLAILTALEPSINLPQWLNFVSPVLAVKDDRYRFAHDKLRETLLEELTPTYRQKLHLRVAEAIESVHPHVPHYYPILASHYKIARAFSREAQYAALAAEQAMSNGLFSEAVTFFERSLELYIDFPIAPPQKAALMSRLSVAYFNLGQLENSRLAAEQAVRLLGVAVPSAAWALGLRIVQEFTRQVWYRLPGNFRFQHQISNIETLENISTLLLHLGYIYEFECKKFFALYNTLKAITLAEFHPTLSFRPVAYYFAAILYQAKPFSYFNLSPRYIALGDATINASKNTATYGHALLAKAVYATIQGQWDMTFHALAEARTCFNDLGSARDVDNILGIQVHSDFLTGDWESCYIHAAFVYDSAESRNDLQATMGSLMWRLSYCIRRGEWDQVQEILEKGHDLLRFPQSNSIMIWSGSLMGLASYYLGDREKAQQLAQSALTVIQAKSPVSNWLHEPFSALAELYLLLWQQGDRAYRQPAKRVCRALEEMSNIFCVSQPCAEIWLGRFAFLDGKPRQAQQRWQTALAKAQHYQTPYYEGLAHYFLAQTESDTHEKEQHLKQALQIFDRLKAIYPEAHQAVSPSGKAL